MQSHMRRQHQLQQQQRSSFRSRNNNNNNNNNNWKDDGTVTTISSHMSSGNSVISAITCPFEQEEAQAVAAAAELRQQRKNQRYSRSSHIAARRTSAPAHMLAETLSGRPGDGLSTSLHGTTGRKVNRRSLMVRSKPTTTGPAFGRSATTESAVRLSTSEADHTVSLSSAAHGRSGTDGSQPPQRRAASRRRATTTAMDLGAAIPDQRSLELPIMNDESLGDLGLLQQQSHHPYRSQSARNLMANIEDVVDEDDEGYDSFHYRPEDTHVSDMDLFEGNLTALDVSRVSHDCRDNSCNDDRHEDQNNEEDKTVSSGERLKDNIDYMTRKSTFAKNMEFIAVRGSYFAQNIDYLQNKTESLTNYAASACYNTVSSTRNAATTVGSTIGNIRRPNNSKQGQDEQEQDLEEEEKRIKGEIRSFFDVGTKVEVLEVMYDPDIVAQVLNKMHAEAGNEMTNNKAGSTRKSSASGTAAELMKKKSEESTGPATLPTTKENNKRSSWSLMSIFTPGSAAVVECRTAS